MKPILEDLPAEVYEQLKRLARRHKSRIFAKKSLGTQSVVHEAYLKLSDSDSPLDQQRFLLQASAAMRSILVDNARHWVCEKRGGKQFDLPLEQVDLVSSHRCDELIQLDNALTQLAREQPRLADVVTCRFFGGLTLEETTTALEISLATVKRDWVLAQTLLYDKLK